jgi:hypothetical protein
MAVAAGVGLIALAVSARAQEPCRAVLPERLQTSAIIEKAETVSAILDDLALRRQAFRLTAANVDLFPTLYYHATLAEFRHAVTLEPDQAETILDLIIVFYDAYQYNRSLFEHRGVEGVEKHWRRYYRGASQKSGLQPVEFTNLLLDGVDAHLTDLARALRYTFGRMKLSNAAMKTLYYSLDGEFGPIAKATEEDIQSVRKDPLIVLESTFGMGGTYVIHARHRAWESAVAEGRLRAYGAQPVLPHERRSRTYFALRPQPGC